MGVVSKILLLIVLFLILTVVYFKFIGLYDDSNMRWECSTVDEDFNNKCAANAQRELLIDLITEPKGMILTAGYIAINIGLIAMLFKKRENKSANSKPC